MADVCDRCHQPAVQNADGKWVHAEVADAVFCGLVMRAPDRVRERAQAIADEDMIAVPPGEPNGLDTWEF